MADSIDNLNPEETSMVPVEISFQYHDLECISDCDTSEKFWISEEDYQKVEEYYVNPDAHYIGVMINTKMPHIRKMVEEKVAYYAMDIFITYIRKIDPDEMYEEDDYDDESNNDNQKYSDPGDDLPF